MPLPPRPAQLLGVRSSVVAVMGISYISSPCINAMYNNGSVVDVTAADGYSTDLVALAATGAQVVFCTAGGYGCPGTPLDVAFPDAAEPTLLGGAEAAGFMSLFFNAEAAATTLVGTVVGRYDCTVDMVARAVAATAATVPAPRVLWAYNYGGPDGWYAGSCPNYYCDAVAAAGGVFITPTAAGTGSYGAYTDAQMAVIAAGADVWLYPSDNWDTEMVAALADGASSVGAVLRGSPAVRRAAVWDVLGRGINAWFEDRLANPDALVEDLAAIVRPDAAAVTDAVGTHAMVWWRNVNTTVAAVTGGGFTCAAPAAPSSLFSSSCPVFGAPGGPSGTTATSGVVYSRATVIGASVGGAVGGVLLLAGLAVGLLLLARRNRTAVVSSTPPKTVAAATATVAAA